MKQFYNYEDFLDDRISTNKIDTITNIQKLKLIEAYNNFPINSTLTLTNNETLTFHQSNSQSLFDYIHHFLIKYNNGKDWYSEKYLTLTSQLIPHLNSFDDRILTRNNDQDRICFIKNVLIENKQKLHVIVCARTDDAKIIPWTHFEAKPAYVRTLQRQEIELIQSRNYFSIIDKNEMTDLEKYDTLKRKTPLYLGSGALSELQKS